jgi:hypothetical protein
MKKYVYKKTELVQKNTGKDSCDGCFFQPLIVRKGVGNSPCCELKDEKFVFPCSKDLIYVKQEEENRL